MDVYVFGSLNMDLVGNIERFPENGETIIGNDYFLNPGGKGGNQAFSASRLGVKTFMIGAVGDDAYGQALTDNLAHGDVDVSHVRASKHHPTGIATIYLQNGENRIIVFPGANHANEIMRVEKALESANDGDIFLTQFECNMDVVTKSIRHAKENNMIVMVNPSPFKTIPDDVWEDVDIVVLNEIESKQLFGVSGYNDKERKTIQTKASGMYLKHVLLTQGSKGVWHIEEPSVTHHPAISVDVVDTTGAGDAFTGGIACSLAQEKTYDEAIKTGVLCATFTITKKGAQAAMPSASELEAFKNDL